MLTVRFMGHIALLAAILLVSGTALGQEAPSPELAPPGSLVSRSLTDHVAVLPSTLARAWAVDPEKGVTSRDVGGGVRRVAVAGERHPM